MDTSLIIFVLSANYIKEGKIYQITSAMQSGRKLGMQTMDEAIFDLYAKRKIN